jgi:hypothetical protein
MLHQKFWSHFFLGLSSRVLEPAILPARMNLFFQRLDSVGQPIGRHAHACQAFLFQELDLINQGSLLRSFEQGRLLTPSSLELRKSAYKGRKAGFMVLTVKPCSVPSPNRFFQGQIKKASTRVGLKTYTTYNFSVGCTWLVF